MCLETAERTIEVGEYSLLREKKRVINGGSYESKDKDKICTNSFGPEPSFKMHR